MTIEIDLNNVLKLEDVRLQDVNSVDGYITELEYFKRLIEHHVARCQYWKDNMQNRPGLGKLHKFLEQLED